MTGSVLAFVRRLLLLAGALVLAMASPATADAAGPSDFRSEITELTPPVDGVSAEIRGGDSFLELEVDEGTEVVVGGYNGEPYLRFQPDGTVQRNRWSTATYINDDRKGAGTIPDRAQDPDTEPEWVEVGSGGTYAWHDHRIHWMSDVSPRVERGSRVGGAYDPWEVPLEVDGQAVAVRGILTYEEAASPLPWIAAAVAALAVVLVLGRRAPVPVASVALLATSAVAYVIGRGEFAGTPDDGANPLLWVLPMVGIATAAGSVALRRKPIAVVLTLASVATLSGWALLRIKVLTKPVLPTDLPFQLDRATTAGALAVAVAGAYLAVSSGALKLPELADDEPGS
jgi:hypothetical protein